jgi:hypothetical protein
VYQKIVLNSTIERALTCLTFTHIGAIIIHYDITIIIIIEQSHEERPLSYVRSTCTKNQSNKARIKIYLNF